MGQRSSRPAQVWRLVRTDFLWGPRMVMNAPPCPSLHVSALVLFDGLLRFRDAGVLKQKTLAYHVSFLLCRVDIADAQTENVRDSKHFDSDLLIFSMEQ